MSQKKNAIDEMEAECELIDVVMSSQQKNSATFMALKKAKWAYAFTVLKHNDEFRNYIKDMTSPLSLQEEEELKEIEKRLGPFKP